MDWTLEDNMVDGLVFCATLTGRRGGYTPSVQVGAETSDTSRGLCFYQAIHGTKTNKKHHFLSKHFFYIF